MRRLLSLVALVLAAGFAVPLASAQNATPVNATPIAAEGNQYTPIIPSVPTAPQWFWGSDERVHLVYELFLTNAFPTPVTVTSVVAINAETGETIGSLDGDALEGGMSLLTSVTVPLTTLQPSSVGVVGSICL
jgi:hypothetical protein